MRNCLDVGRSHAFRFLLSDPMYSDTCRSCPVLSGNGSVMITGVGEDGNRDARLWDHPPMRS